MQPERPIFCTLVALVLGGCTTVSDVSDAPADDCGAAGYAAFVGQPVAAVTLPDTVNHRIIGPDDAVTMDYISERLNIRYGDDGLVEEVYCG